MKISQIANSLRTMDPDGASAALKHIADELRHVRSVLALALRRRRHDAVLVRALTRRRNELLRRMQVVAHGASRGRDRDDWFRSYH